MHHVLFFFFCLRMDWTIFFMKTWFLSRNNRGLKLSPGYNIFSVSAKGYCSRSRRYGNIVYLKCRSTWKILWSEVKQPLWLKNFKLSLTWVRQSTDREHNVSSRRDKEMEFLLRGSGAVETALEEGEGKEEICRMKLCYELHLITSMNVTLWFIRKNTKNKNKNKKRKELERSDRGEMGKGFKKTPAL